MGNPGDVERFRDVVTFLQEQGLPARRVRVGSIEVEIAVAPPLLPSLALPRGDAHLSPVEPIDPEEEARLRREYEEATMYGASEGVDLGRYS